MESDSDDDIDTLSERASRPSIRYGDLISLHDMTINGFVSAKLSSHFESALEILGQTERTRRGVPSDASGIGNVMEGVFKICAPNKFRMAKKVVEIKAAKMEAGVQLSDDQQYQQAKQLAEEEAEDNVELQARRLGDCIKFGQTVQLQHCYSNKYIKVDHSNTSVIEHANLKVKLDEHTRLLSHFRIMPKFKVHTEGVEVREHDQILLESVKITGQYLHSSAVPSPEDSLSPGCHEVNLSVVATPLDIYLFRGEDKKIAVKKGDAMDQDMESMHVRGGTVIRLQAAELEGYLAAEGVFSEDTFTEDVHIRQRLPDPERPRRLLPPTSAVSFWQVEKRVNMSGAYLEWDEVIRLKHLPTQMYLTFHNSSDNLTLSSKVDAACTAFKFVAVSMDAGGSIDDGVYVRLEHVVTKRSVSGEKMQSYIRSSSIGQAPVKSALATRMSGVQWDGAPLVDANLKKAGERAGFECAFRIEIVEDEQVQNVNFLCGLIPVLQHFTNIRHKRELTDAESSRMISILGEAEAFVYINEVAQRRRQKLFRNLRIVDQLMKTLQAPFEQYNKGGVGVKLQDLDSWPNTKAVCNAIFRVLKAYLDGSSRKNELYMAQHIAFLYTLVGGFLDVEPLFAELFRDNQKIIAKISPAEMETFANLLKAGDKDPDYLEILGVFCSCDEIPIRSNQDHVTQILLEESRDVVHLTALHDHGPEISTDGGRTWQDMVRFCQADPETGERSEEYEFFEMQLQLFNTLTAGRNKYSIDLIANKFEYLTWDECFVCAQNPKLPAPLRQAYVTAIIRLYVDCGSNIDINAEIQLSFDWNNIIPESYRAAEADKSSSISGARLPQFPALSVWIEAVLVTHQSMIAAHTEENEFVEEVLVLLDTLIMFGYYTNKKQCVDLILALEKLIDGSDDSAVATTPTDHLYDDAPSHDDTLLKKAATLAGSPSAPPPNNDEWRNKQRYQKSIENEVLINCKCAALDCVDTMIDMAMTTRLQRMLFDFKHMKEEGTLQGHSGILAFLGEDSPVDDDSREDATDFLDTIANDEGRWINLDQEEGNLPLSLLDLAQYEYDGSLRKSLALITRLHESRDELCAQSQTAMILTEPTSVELHMIAQKQMPLLRRLGRGVVDQANTKNLVQILTFFSNKCRMHPTMSPHPVNQQIITNTGIMNVLFDLIGYQGQSSKVLAGVFGLLGALANKFEPVQKLVFARLDSLLKCQSSSRGWQNEMAMAVASVFSENDYTCKMVNKLHITQLVRLLSEQTVDAPTLPQAMCAMVKLTSTGRIFKRNQIEVIKAVIQNRDTCLMAALIDDVSSADLNRQRLNLLRTNSDPAKLQYHLGLVSLFASCAEGRDRFIESVCQSVFSLDEVMQVILDPEVIPTAKSAYCRFLLWVYLHCSTLTGALQANPIDANVPFFNGLSDLAMKLIPPSGETRRILTSEQQKFFYLAFLPLVEDLANRHYDPDEHPETKAPFEQMTTLVCTLVKQIADPTEVQTATINACLYVLEDTFMDDVGLLQTIMDAINHKPELTNTSRNKDTGSLKPGRRASMELFEQRYKQQNQINDEFNLFAKNLNKAFQGTNTIEDQIPESKRSSVRGEGVSEDDMESEYCEPKGSDEYLPLGSDFRGFVKLFVETDDNGRPIDLDETILTCLVRCWRVTMTCRATLCARDQSSLDKVTIRTLQAVRAMLHNMGKLGLPVTDMQNEVASLGAVVALVEMLASPDANVIQETLAVFVQILIGGNLNAQTAFLEYAMGTREERFFDCMKALIRRGKERVFEHGNALASGEKDANANSEDGASQAAGRRGAGAGAGGKPSDGAAAKKDAAAFHRDQKNQSVTSRGSMVLRNGQVVSMTGEGMVKTGEMAAAKSRRGNGTAGSKRSAKVGPSALIVVESADGQNSEDEPIENFGNLELLLRLVQLLCEGHNEEVQNYFRDQRDNVVSVNVVAEIAEVLDVISASEDDLVLPVLCQTMFTLGELTTGCADNQVAIFDLNAIDNINTVLRAAPKLRDPALLASLHMACALLVQTLVEDNTDNMASVAQNLADALDLRPFFRKMQDYHEANLQPSTADGWTLPDGEMMDPETTGYEFYRAIAMLQDHTGTAYQTEMLTSGLALGETHEAYSCYQEKSLTIEILRNDRLQKLHFYFVQQEQLTNAMKEDLKWHVNTDSPTDKIRDFVERARVMAADIKYLVSVANYSVLTRILVLNPTLWRQFALASTFALNGFMLASWQANPDATVRAPSVNGTVGGHYYPIFYALGSLQCMSAFLVVLAFYMIHPISLKASMASIPFLGGFISGFIPDTESKQTKMSIFSVYSVYHVIYLALAALGMWPGSYGYPFGFHMLHILIDNDTLSRVLQSVTRNFSMLMQVMLLLTIMMYLFSLWAFAFRRHDFVEATGEYCTSAFQCFISSIRLGLLAGGGLGEVLITADNGKRGSDTIFDIAFFLIITIVGLNVVFGIIVDSFSELRDEKFQRKDQMESECFICTIKNYEFEQRASGFQDHVHIDHHMWNYLFYMIYLMDKDATEYSSHEHYIAKVLEADNDVASFFPINRSLSLDGNEANKDLENRIDDIRYIVEGIADSLDKSNSAQQRKAKKKQLGKFVNRAKAGSSRAGTAANGGQAPPPAGGSMPGLGPRRNTTFLE